MLSSSNIKEIRSGFKGLETYTNFNNKLNQSLNFEINDESINN